MSFVPKTVLKALDKLEAEIDRIDSLVQTMEGAEKDISLALIISGLLVMLKKSRGEEIDEAMKEFDKCSRAFERLQGKRSAIAGGTEDSKTEPASHREPAETLHPVLDSQSPKKTRLAKENFSNKKKSRKSKH